MDSIEGATPRGTRAFEDLLSANLDSLYRMSLSLCDEADDAEDLLQESVLRAFQHRDQLRELRAGRSWLFRILIRTHLNQLRREKRRAETVERDLGEREFERALADWSTEKSGGGFLERLADTERVARAVRELDSRLRAVLLLSDVEELSHREIATALEIPEGTVASRLFRARHALREILSREETVSVWRKAR